MKPALRRLVLRQYDRTRSPTRIAVGDVIVCADFRSGIQFPDVLFVAAPNPWADYHVKSGRATQANDPSRATAPFLVVSIALTEGSGPEDVSLDEYRLSRDVECLRLTDDYCLTPRPERIRFNLDEPMSVVHPSEESIQIIGFAELPITWDETRT